MERERIPVMHKRYLEQVKYMLQMLPHVMDEKAFALKGGTAINFFVRDVPRLSVDIDLVYTPIQDRATSLLEISEALFRIKEKLLSHFIGCTITEKRLSGNYCIKLFVKFASSLVVIEPNTVLRGTVYPTQKQAINPTLKKRTGIDVFMSVPVLVSAELYGGKIVAALDRQHPRDLFDIKILLQHEGITNDIRHAFVVYLAGHGRPMHEILSPKLHDMRRVFVNEFEGLAMDAVKYIELESARTELIKEIHSGLNENERQFLLSVKNGEPKWDLIPIKGIENLPALKWKLTNIHRMNKSKRLEQVNRLKHVLKL